MHYTEARKLFHGRRVVRFHVGVDFIHARIRNHDLVHPLANLFVKPLDEMWDAVLQLQEGIYLVEVATTDNPRFMELYVESTTFDVVCGWDVPLVYTAIVRSRDDSGNIKVTWLFETVEE